jgi:hypothetical protein
MSHLKSSGLKVLRVWGEYYYISTSSSCINIPPRL